VSEEIKSAGYGDGSDADSFGAYRCWHWANITHPHLGGDFIRRDVAGDTIIMNLEKYEALARDLLDARRERDAARKALLWTWDKAEAREEDPSGNTLAAVAAARAAGGGKDE